MDLQTVAVAVIGIVVALLIVRHFYRVIRHPDKCAGCPIKGCPRRRERTTNRRRGL